MSMFSKRHYDAFESMMRRHRPEEHWDRNKMTQWALIRDDTAAMFAADNPKFDRDKFLKACQPKDN